MQLFIKLKGHSARVPLSSIYELISEIVLKKYICPIQIDRINWKLFTCTNVTSKDFFVRLPLYDCRGKLKMPLSKVSLDHNYASHLYHSTPATAKFILKGVPNACMSDPELNQRVDNLTSIFMDDLPLLHAEDKESSYFKFVKQSNRSSHEGMLFREIQVAYP
uniref:Uncharacterized protein n=1 Tax=Rhodymenia pseudopalmata TaxID=31502 RepID=A0A1C9C7H9_RHOPU|nr:hypothetical protein Rhodyp_055 [Rhodymenia pseudopalmata]AOM64333.1 hypothetical protein Rhodyp_055 [Rhodymenia pseudopalmata]